MRLGQLLWVLLLMTGCFKLDPFLFAATSEDHYVFDPDSDDPAERVTEDRIEPLRVTVNDQIQCGAVNVKANVTPSLGQVYYFPGQGSTLDDAFPRIKRLANLGYDVFALNYRGFGTSTKATPTESGIQEDVNAGLVFLRARLPAGAKLGYYGRSLGTAITVELAVTAPPDAMVLESPFASIAALKSDSSGMDFPVSYIANVRFDTVDHIAEVHTPLLILHGLVDDYVRHEFGEQVYAAANEPKRLVLVPGADHSNVPEKMGDDYGVEVGNLFAHLTP